jgi:hypothetical protein
MWNLHLDLDCVLLLRLAGWLLPLTGLLLLVLRRRPLLPLLPLLLLSRPLLPLPLRRRQVLRELHLKQQMLVVGVVRRQQGNVRAARRRPLLLG